MGTKTDAVRISRCSLHVTDSARLAAGELRSVNGVYDIILLWDRLRSAAFSSAARNALKVG